MLEQKTGFIKMEYIVNKEENVISIDIKDDKALIFTSYSNDKENYHFRLILYNLRWNRLIAEKTIDDEEMLFDEFNAEFIDDKVLALCNVNENKADTYNYDLELLNKDIEFTSKKIKDYSKYYSEKVSANPLIDESYVNWDSFATDTLGQSSIIVFYDDSKSFFVQKYNENESIIASIDKRVFTCNEGRESLTFQIKDYSASMIINSADIALSVPTDEDMSRAPYITGFSEKYIVAPILNNSGSIEAIYYWNYTSNQSQKSFETEKINYNSIDEYINKTQKNIENNYSINVKINPNTFDADKPLLPEKNKLKLYLSLLLIDEAYSRFPEGMLKEMYNYENGFEKLCIYLCNYIDDGFTNAYAGNANGESYIVYATRSLNYSIIAHELMHAAEHRIWTVCGDKYDIEWEKLNPPGFNYVGDSYGSYDENEQVEKYFARDYGRASENEDRAVIFEYLFCYGADDMFFEWDKESPVYKKAKLICDALRESYPSVRNADNVIWEKYLNE